MSRFPARAHGSTITHVERFRSLIARRLGLTVDENKLRYLQEFLERRLEVRKTDADHYLEQFAEAALPADEERAIRRELSVSETYFYRNSAQFTALSELVLPEILRDRSGKRTLNILSAGCSSGEEAYTLAMLIADAELDPSWRVLIRAVDMNAESLGKAAVARYKPWSLRETPTVARQRWFDAHADEYVVKSKIVAMVRFEERNLADANPDLWMPEFYDLVFCRNTLMYFVPEAAAELVRRISQSMVSGGHLFLGHAESLRGISHDFHLRHARDAFFYQRKHRHDFELVPTSVGGGRTTPVPASESENWADAIDRASQRIQALSESHTAFKAAPDHRRPNTELAWDLARTTELLRHERFADALTEVEALPAESRRDPKVMLLRALLLAQAAKIGEARRTCEDLLGIDELNAGAHYVLALCHESEQDTQAAMEHHHFALHLDPTFAMASLHLGLLAKRTGDMAAARRELSRALRLLERDEASRLLLFGGGFNREALVALCRSGLATTGGAA
jgi:chemotaxis protein methyltransferase CheR